MVQVNEESGNRRPIIVLFEKKKAADDKPDASVKVEKEGDISVVIRR